MKTGIWLTDGIIQAIAVMTLMASGVTHTFIFRGFMTTRQRSTAITTVSMLGTKRRRKVVHTDGQHTGNKEKKKGSPHRGSACWEQREGES